MKTFTWRLSRLVCLSVVFGLVLGCSQAEDSHSSHSSAEVRAASAGDGGSEVPQEFRAGEERFNTFCSRCHGIHGRGTENGPPLVHKIYEPSHHGDFTFFRAAARGVRAHHWEFGNMPQIVDASEDDVRLIIRYIRWLQREAGIY